MDWEYTNATTTQLVNINSDDWDESLLACRKQGQRRSLVWSPDASG
ncbi:hypothetical protein ACLB1Q_20480 [Escherichia coli]